MGGQYGRISRPQIAAYNPVFWLHHYNIDQLIAVNQAINIPVWWPSELDKLKEPVPNVPLFPFRSCAGSSSWWTSEDLKTTDTFGYTYTDLSIRDPEKLANDFPRRHSWSQNAEVIREWYIDSIANRLVLNGPFTVFAFIGDLDENTTAHYKTTTLAGVAPFFIASPDDCENLKALGRARAQVSHSTIVTSTLGDYVASASLAVSNQAAFFPPWSRNSYSRS